MHLSKHHGLGNDFLVLLRDDPPDPRVAAEPALLAPGELAGAGDRELDGLVEVHSPRTWASSSR